MREKIHIGLVTAMAFLFLASVSGYAAEKIVIKGTSVQMPNQSMGEALLEAKKRIEARLPGQVEMKAYPSAQLYTQTEEITALSRGEIQMASVIGTGSLPVVSPVFQLIELPGLFPNRDVFRKALQGPVGKELWGEAEKKNIKVLSFWNAGKTQISNRKRVEIKLPKDAAGLKIRPAGKTYAAILESWGAMSVNVASEEQYSALQQGVIDGMLTATRIIHERKLYENLTNLTDLEYLVLRANALLVNKKWWDALPADVQKVISAVGAEVAELMIDVVNRDEVEAATAIAASGTKVYQIPEKDYRIWQESARKVWPKLIGKGGQTWVDKLAQAADKTR
ncbi:MAG: TRAP transporter substrate-binding protein [Thermodesulfobacteriota bacterium]